MTIRTSEASAADLHHWAIEDLETSGLHVPERRPGGGSTVWTGAGETASVFFQLDRSDEVRVAVELIAGGAADAPCWDELVVRLDGAELESVERTSRAGSLLLSGTATAHPVAGDEHVLELRGPLEERLVGDDRRRLGVALQAVSVQVLEAVPTLGRAEPATAGDGHELAAEARQLDSSGLCWAPAPGESAPGLYATEATESGRAFAWTGAEERVTLALPWDLSGHHEVVFELRAQATAAPDCWAGIDLSLDGVPLEVLERWIDGSDLVLRARCIDPAPTRGAVLTLAAPRVSMPPDPRQLGIALVEIRAWPVASAPEPVRRSRPAHVGRTGKRFRAVLARRAPTPVRRVVRLVRRGGRAATQERSTWSEASPQPSAAPLASREAVAATAHGSTASTQAEIDELREALSLLARDLSVLRELRQVLHRLIDRVAELERRLDEAADDS